MSEPPPSSAVAEESYVDVLIIGAGPAGVMCANALVRAGIPVRIVDIKFVLTIVRVLAACSHYACVDAGSPR